MFKQGVGAVLWAAAVMAGISAPAEARGWKPTPYSQAMDYLQIVDMRSQSEMVFVIWVTPELAGNQDLAKELLDKYVIVGVAHSRMGPAGTSLYDAIDSLEVRDGNGAKLKALTGDAIPENVAQFLAGMGGALKQNLGALGQGLHFFVFESGGIASCAKGGLVIPHDGEEYTYDAPIPGCTGK